MRRVLRAAPLMLNEQSNILTSTEEPTTSKADPEAPHHTQARRPLVPWYGIISTLKIPAVTPEFPQNLDNTSPEYFRHHSIEFKGLNPLIEKVTAVASLTRVRVVVDHTMTTPLQRSTKLKISHWHFDQCLYRIIFCQKHIEQAFFYVIFFHTHPFNEMFIVNGKSHCSNDTFTDVRFTSLLAKNI